MIDHRSMLI